MINYKKLRDELDKIIPEKYRNNPVKNHYMTIEESKIYNYMHDSKFRYCFIDNDSGYYIDCYSKGEYYFLDMLYTINEYKDYNALAPFFIYVFFHEFKKETVDIYGDDISDDLYYTALNEFRESNYGPVHHACKRILPIYNFNDNVDINSEINMYINPIKAYDEKKLAKTILDVFETILKHYHLEYWTLYDNKKNKKILQDILSGLYKY